MSNAWIACSNPSDRATGFLWRTALGLAFAASVAIGLLFASARSVLAGDGTDDSDFHNSPDDANDSHRFDVRGMDRTELTRAFAGQLTVLPQDQTARAAQARNEIVFIDPNTPERAKLVRSIGPRAKVIELAAGRDGLSQIAEALAAESNVDALHIISHGEEGRIKLVGSADVSVATLPEHFAQLKAIHAALRPDADVLLYGCDIAKGADGKLFVELLARLTGEHVAASEHRTGAARRGGDWTLAYHTGTIKTQVLAPNQSEHYDAVLATVTTNTDSGAGSLRDAIANASNGDTIDFAPGLAGQTITLTTVGDTTFGPSALKVSNTLTIDGSGAPGLTISGDTTNATRNLRLFIVTGTGNLTLKNLTLTNGQIAGGKGGGSDHAIGGHGGGAAGLGGAIFLKGALSLFGCTLNGNRATGGAGGIDFNAAFNSGGGGGGLAADGANAGPGTVSYGFVVGAFGGNGGGPNGGAGGYGGFTSTNPGQSATGPGGGGGGGGASVGSGIPGKNGGSGAFGGGGGGGGKGGGGSGIGGTGGFGGGGGSGAQTGVGGAGGFGGGTGANGGGYGGGGAGMGGAIFSYGGTANLTNCTITGNSAIAGSGAGSSKGYGGGIFNRNGSVTVLNSTIAGNTANDGGGGIYNLGDGTGNTGTLVLNNTIVANSTSTAISGKDLVGNTNASGSNSTSGVGNLIVDQTGFAGVVLISSDPQLSSLANNGGPTPTLAPASTSPVIGTAVSGVAPSLDQRGYFRPSSPSIGSFDYNLSVAGQSPGALPDGTVGAAFSQTITASGGTSPYTFTVTGGALPAGLSLSSGGVVSGTPSAAGSFNVTVTATDSTTVGNGGPLTSTQLFSLNVNQGTPVFSNLSAPTIVFGTSTTNLSGTISLGALIPTGTVTITVNSVPQTATVQGDGSFSSSFATGALTAGSYPITYQYNGDANFIGVSDNSNNLTVSLSLSPATLPDAQVGVAYSQTLTADGGTGPYTFALSTGTLPAGVTLSSAGAITGTPTEGGSFPITVTATDSSSAPGPYTGSLSYTLISNPPSIVIAPPALSAQVGRDYSQTIIASGGTAPYTFSVAVGPLPDGLTLTPGGLLSGTPTANGTFNFTIQATDSSTGTGPFTQTQAYSLTTTQVTETAGLAGGALQFDAANKTYGRINVPARNDFTIEFWFNSASVSGADGPWYAGQGLLDAEVGGTTTDFGISLLNGKIHFGIGMPDTTIRSAPVADGTWHHVAATRDNASGAMTLYIDGVLAAFNPNGPAGPRLAPGAIYIGADSNLVEPDSFYTGALDEIRIWNTVRTPSQIQDNMHATLNGNEPGLVTYLRCDDAFGSAGAADSSPSANNATFFIKYVTPSTASQTNSGAGIDTVRGSTLANQRIVLSGFENTASALTTTVTTLPATGTLYQADGTTAIAAGDTVTDPSHVVVYAPNGTATDTFSYTITDASASVAGPATVNVIVLGGTTTAVTSSANPSVFGQSVDLTATITAPGGGDPAGLGGEMVQFFEGSAPLGAPVPATTTAGVTTATLTLSTLATGSHNITAYYQGDAGFFGSTSPVFTQTINRDDTAVALACSPAPGVAGSPLVCTVTVTAQPPGAGIPTQNIDIHVDNAVAVAGTSMLDASGKCTISIAPLALGMHTISATYNGDTNFNSSTNAITVVVAEPSTTNLTADVNPSDFGQTVTFTATVTDALNPAQNADGTVLFSVNGVVQSVQTLVNGAATFATSTLGVGSSTISASYVGNATFVGSTASLTQTVNQLFALATLTVAPTPSVIGQPVTFTAATTSSPTLVLNGSFEQGFAGWTVSANGIASTPDSLGSISSTDGAKLALIETPDDSIATDTSAISGLCGDGTTQPGTNGTILTQQVVLSSGQTVSVDWNYLSNEDPDSQYDFAAGDLLDSNGFVVASFFEANSSLLSGSAPGSGYDHQSGWQTSTVTAPDDGVFTLRFVVTNTQDTTVSSALAIDNITPSAQFISPAPSGNVNFTDFNTGAVLATVPLNGGIATYTTSALTLGDHDIIALYVGDANYPESLSNDVNQTVNQAATNAVVVSSGQLVADNDITLTATVTAAAPGAGTPTGTVTFNDGTTTLGTVTLISGSASFTTELSVAGSTHNITAVYNGDANFITSTSATLPLDIDPADTTTTITASPASTSVFGQPVTFTATVQSVPPSIGVGAGPNSVVFTDAVDGVIGTVTPVNGVAKLTISNLSVSSLHSIHAQYTGSVEYNASDSATDVAFEVDQDSTTTTVTSSLNPALVADSVTLTATVAADAPGAGTPTGTITFLDGTTTLGAQLLSGGTATLTTSALSAATHAITVAYAGDTNFTASTSSTLNQVVNAQSIPGITALTPSSALVGSSAINVLVNGANFVSGSVVNFNGLSRPTTFVTSTLLIVSLPAADLTAIGVFPITVTTPGAGGSTSSASNFTVLNPTPVVVSVGPDTAFEGDPALKITVSGVNFVPGSVVKFGTASLTTTFVSSTELTATIPASSLAAGSAGSVDMTVVNAGPGGGTSNADAFTIGKFTVNSPPTAMPNPAKVGQSVLFSVGASTSNNGALSYAWDFGDTTSGSGPNPTHTYTAVGTYSATVTITVASGAKITANVNVVVESPDIGNGALPPGTFTDTTGSGVPDEMSSAAATVGITKASSSTPLPNVKLAIKLNFAKPGSDTITLSAKLDTTAANKAIVIDVGGVIKAFKLDAKGSAKAGGDSVLVSPKTGLFTAKFTKGSFATILASSGLTNTTVSGKSLNVRVGVVYNDTTFYANQPQLYKATQGKTGGSK